MSKFIVPTKPLASELAFHKEILIDKNNPQWSYILFEAEGSQLTLSATNGQITTITTLPLDKPVAEPIKVGIPGRKLFDIVRLLDTETVTINVSESQVNLSAGTGRYRFGLNPNVLSHIKPLANLGVVGKTTEVDSISFVRALRTSATFAANKETTQYTFTNIGVNLSANDIVMRAMDGHRAIDFKVEDKADGREDSFMINAIFVNTIADVAVTKTTKIIRSEGHQRYESGNRICIVLVGVGKLPEISSHIDKYADLSISAIMDSKLLLNTIKRLQTAVDGKWKKVLIDVQDGSLKMQSIDTLSDCNEFEEEIPAVTNGSGKCSLNAGYIEDYLKAIEGSVTLRVGSSQKDPAFFISGTGLRYLVSQMG